MGNDVIARFRAGDDIPEWLLVREPLQKGAPKGVFRFAADTYVIDLPQHFLWVLEQEAPRFIDDAGMQAHRVYAASKPVALVHKMSGIMPLGQEAWVLAGAVAPQVPVADPHRGFWARLRALLLLTGLALAGCDRITPMHLLHNCQDRAGGIYRDERGDRWWALYATDGGPHRSPPTCRTPRSASDQFAPRWALPNPQRGRNEARASF